MKEKKFYISCPTIIIFRRVSHIKLLKHLIYLCPRYLVKFVWFKVLYGSFLFLNTNPFVYLTNPSIFLVKDTFVCMAYLLNQLIQSDCLSSKILTQTYHFCNEFLCYLPLRAPILNCCSLKNYRHS